MSVFVRGKKGIYTYSFQTRGVPFFGTTGCTTKREALDFEKQVRESAEADLKKRKAATTGPLTFDAALAKLWNEVGTYYTGTYRTTVETSLGWLLEKSGIGGTTLLRDIGPALINDAIARRRGEGVSASTVNRTVTELVRLLLIRARDHGEQEIKPIDWKKYLLDEPKERIRSLGTEEETLLIDTMRDDYLPAIRFKLKSGFRKREVVNLKKSDIDWGERVIHVIGKGGKPATIPLTAELREILWPLQEHPTDYVFTYTAQATRPHLGLVRGERYRMTYSGLASAWRRFGPKKAGISDFRLHDLRHTAATRLGRGGKADLQVIQHFLRHDDIASTVRYRHVYDDDIRAAMEAETEARQNPLQIPLQDAKKKA